MRIKYEVVCKIAGQLKKKKCFEELTLEEVEETCDIEETLIENLEQRFNTFCSCINESQTYCECAPVVEDVEIIGREFIV